MGRVEHGLFYFMHISNIVNYARKYLKNLRKALFPSTNRLRKKV